MSSKVGFQHFTKIVKIFFPHECPQKLVFNILLYLWRYFFLTKVLKSWFSTFYYICEDIFSSQRSSKVGFQHFTIIVRIYFPHECPQKLVFNILLYLWGYIFLTNVLKSCFSTFYYNCEDIFFLMNVLKSWFPTFYYICEDIFYLMNVLKSCFPTFYCNCEGILSWIPLRSWSSTFYYNCEDIFLSWMSSEVCIQHFTIFVRICFLSWTSSEVGFQHFTIIVRIFFPHECPQK